MQQTVLSGSGSVRMQNTTNLFGSRGAADLSLSTPMLLPSLLIRSPAKGASCLVSHCARPTRGVCDRALRGVHGAKNNERHARVFREANRPLLFPALSFSHPSPGNGRVALQLRASDEHCFIVRVLRARRAAGRSRYPYIMSLQARLFVFLSGRALLLFPTAPVERDPSQGARSAPNAPSNY